MPSSVVHIRLDDWAIIGCYDILQAGGKPTVNLPTSTIVREVLNGLVRRMQSSGHIPTYTQEQRLARARELYGGEFDIGLDITPSDLILDGGNLEEPESSGEPPLSIEEIARKAELAILDSGTPQGVRTKVDVAPVVDPPTSKVPKVDLLSIPTTLGFEDCKKLAPKDRLIEWASDQDEVVQKAVALCYSNIARDLWGTERAQEIVEKLLASHKLADG